MSNQRTQRPQKTQSGLMPGHTIYAPPSFQTLPGQVERVGVIGRGGIFHVFTHAYPYTGEGVYYVLNAEPLMSARTPDALAHQLMSAGVGSVWTLDEEGWPDLSRSLLNSPDFVSHELSSGGALSGVVIQHRKLDGSGYGIPVCVFAPFVNDPWGAWSKMCDLAPISLARSVALVAFTLNMQLRFSASYTGLTMLRQELFAWEWRNGPLPQLSDEGRETLANMRPSYAMWRQPLANIATGYEAIDAEVGIQLWAYDRNSSFVSSAREVGVGDPVLTNEFHPSRPGVYFVTSWRPNSDTLDTLIERGIPGPFAVGSDPIIYPLDSADVNLPLGGVWAWEPQIRHAYRYGYEVEIAGGYYWPKRGDTGTPLDGWYRDIQPQNNRVHDLFREWQARIWAARDEARTCGDACAEAMIKKIGVATIGRLIQRSGRAVVASEQAERDSLDLLATETDMSGELTGRVEVEMALGRTDLIQPGWWSTIISNANERLWNAVYSAAFYSRTALAYIDGMFTDLPVDALNGPRDKVGGFRAAGEILVPTRDIAQLDTLPATELVKAFARYARENEAAQNG